MYLLRIQRKLLKLSDNKGGCTLGMCFCFWKQVGDFVEIPALLRSELCCPDGRHGASQRPSHRRLWGVLQPKAFGPSGREVDQRQHGVPSAVTAAVLLCSGSGGLGVGHRVPTPGSAVGRAGRGLVRVVPERLLSLVVGSLNPFLCPSYDLISLQSCLYHVFPEFLMLCSRLAWQPGAGPSPGMCSLPFLLFLYM